MRFLTTYRIQPQNQRAAIARFLETGGAPPAGVRMLQRWHGMNGAGVTVSETDDPKAIFQWVAQWSDVLEFDVSPCLDDSEAGPVLAAIAKR